MFWESKDNMEGKFYVFSGYKQRIQALFVFLECKVQ